MPVIVTLSYTVPKVINFPRYNTKCSGENEILIGIFLVISRVPLRVISRKFELPFGQCRFTFLKQQAC